MALVASTSQVHCYLTHLSKHSRSDMVKRAGKAKLDNEISVAVVNTPRPEENDPTYEVTSATIASAKYIGLNKIAIASFHPKTTSNAYTHLGICAKPAIVLLSAST